MCNTLPVLEVEKYDQLIEGNRHKIVCKINANVFLDQLREKAIFSPDEAEQITNSPQFVTRRTKAGKFHSETKVLVFSSAGLNLNESIGDTCTILFVLYQYLVPWSFLVGYMVQWGMWNLDPVWTSCTWSKIVYTSIPL